MQGVASGGAWAPFAALRSGLRGSPFRSESSVPSPSFLAPGCSVSGPAFSQEPSHPVPSLLLSISFWGILTSPSPPAPQPLVAERRHRSSQIKYPRKDPC